MEPRFWGVYDLRGYLLGVLVATESYYLGVYCKGHYFRYTEIAGPKAPRTSRRVISKSSPAALAPKVWEVSDEHGDGKERSLLRHPWISSSRGGLGFRV